MGVQKTEKDWNSTKTGRFKHPRTRNSGNQPQQIDIEATGMPLLGRCSMSRSAASLYPAWSASSTRLVRSLTSFLISFQWVGSPGSRQKPIGFGGNQFVWTHPSVPKLGTARMHVAATTPNILPCENPASSP